LRKSFCSFPLQPAVGRNDWKNSQYSERESATRWSTRESAVRVIAELFDDLTELLQDMTEDRGVARNLLWGTKRGDLGDGSGEGLEAKPLEAREKC